MTYTLGSLRTQFDTLEAVISRIKRVTDIASVELASDIQAHRVTELAAVLKAASADLTDAATVAGMQNYIREEKDDPTFNLAAELTPIRDGCDAVWQQIVDDMPTHDGTAGGYVLAYTWGSEGLHPRTFSSAAVAGIKTLVDSLAALIG